MKEIYLQYITLNLEYNFVYINKNNRYRFNHWDVIGGWENNSNTRENNGLEESHNCKFKLYLIY